MGRKTLVQGNRNVVIEGDVQGGIFVTGDDAEAQAGGTAPPTEDDTLAGVTPTAADPMALAIFDTLVERFSLDELHTLCFRLGVDTDSLPGDGKVAQARELVRRYQRQGRLATLRLAVEAES